MAAMRKSLPLVLALSLAIPLTAEADVFDIHVGGICSTNFGSTLGHWTGETSINAPIDQTTSMATATTQMAATLDRYCTGSNLCFVYVYSNGGAVMSRTLALKTDGGSGALEQMVLGEYCIRNFSKHVPELRRGLRAKLETLMESLQEHFGSAAEFEDPKGGIFLWVKLPDGVDAMKLYEPALAAGVAINPGPQWSVNKEHSRSRMRLCFASPSHEEINQGVAALADVCRRQFGVPR